MDTLIPTHKTSTPERFCVKLKISTEMAKYE